MGGGDPDTSLAEDERNGATGKGEFETTNHLGGGERVVRVSPTGDARTTFCLLVVSHSNYICYVN